MKKKRLLIFVAVVTIVSMALFVHKSLAIEFDFLGSPVNLMGYVQQSVNINVEGKNNYDTQKGFNSALFQALLEVEYSPHPNWRFFGSIKANADWAYPLLRENNEWGDKGFNQSKNRLYAFDTVPDILNEAHLTWTPGDFYFRVGKQIIAWGETDGFRLVDQINPVDQRRGLGDVQFENTILPLWLVRAEYRVPVKSSWLQDLGLQFIFNPNLEFRGDEAITLGNDKWGVWAPLVKVPLGHPYPFDFAYLGSFDENIHKPTGSEGMGYGFRVRGLIYETTITLNYFAKRDNDPARIGLNLPPRMEASSYDGRFIMHLAEEGFYPRFEYVGATFSRDLPWLRASFLGGVSPVLRMETMYAFHSTFGSSINTFEKKDEFRWMVGSDWKVKIPFLNAKAYFFISPQFYYRDIIEYPHNCTLIDSATLGPLNHNNYQTSLLVNTTYFHNKLAPSFFWLYDITHRSNLFKPQISWEQNSHWKYSLGALFFDGLRKTVGLEPFNNKNQIYATVDYRF